MLVLTLLLLTAGWQLASAGDNLAAPPSLQLHRAVVMFRHGIRYSFWDPLNLSPDRSTFKIERGTLTPQGKQLMGEVGRSLGTRYSTAAYQELLVTSSSSDRAKESAQLVVEGMLARDWRQVSVDQQTPYDKHKLFERNPPCVVYARLKAEIERNEPDYGQYYALINREVALNHPTAAATFKVDSLFTNFKLWDALNTDILLQKATPTWTIQYMVQMEELAKLQMWRNIHSREGMLSFFAGPILSRVQQVLANGPYKYQFHGSHDVTLNAVLWALGGRSWETYSIRQGDCLIVEQYTTGQINVALYSPLETDYTQRFKPVTSFDSLLSFQNSLQNIFLTEQQWQHKCNNAATSYTAQRSPPNY